jgi:hypothetical protein
MTPEAVVLGGLVVVVAAFGFALANAGRSPNSGYRRDHDDGGPGVLVSDSTPSVGFGGSGNGGEGGGGDGCGDGGGGDGGGNGD